MEQKTKKPVIRHSKTIIKLGCRLHEPPSQRRSALRKGTMKFGIPKLMQKLRGLKMEMKQKGNSPLIPRDINCLKEKEEGG